jgi:hypothetical protein
MGVSDNCRYQWTVPQANSTTCRLRITATAGGETSQYISPGDFSILQGVGVEANPPAPPTPLSVAVFPNPCTFPPAVRVEGMASGSGELQVYDLSGRMVLRIPVHSRGPHEFFLQREGGAPLPAGVYAAVLKTAAGTAGTMFVQLGN